MLDEDIRAVMEELKSANGQRSLALYTCKHSNNAAGTDINQEHPPLFHGYRVSAVSSNNLED